MKYLVYKKFMYHLGHVLTFSMLTYAGFVERDQRFSCNLCKHQNLISNLQVVTNDHSFNEAVGYTLFIIYSLLGITVLFNLLIAMMSSSYAKIEVITLAI